MAATRSSLEGVAQLTRQLIALGKLDDGKVLRGAVAAGMAPAKKRFLATMAVGTEPHRLSATYGKLLVAPGYAHQHVKLITTINGQKNIASAVLGVTKEAFYIVNFVELGTRYQAAQPQLRRALSESRSDGEEALRDYFGRAVEKAAKTT